MDDPSGIISGEKINSEGLTFNQNGLIALYGVTINHGSIKGSFDWGTETTSNELVVAAPLETPAVWSSPYPWNDIEISASKISSYSVALDGKKVVSNDWAIDKDVSTTDWINGYGFAKPSEAKL
jgi:hypothetical protein